MNRSFSRWVPGPLKFQLVSDNGAYNLITAPPDGFDEHAADDIQWPEALARERVVVRQTRTDPFDGPTSVNPTFRCLRFEEAVEESALALMAASMGIGPRVHALYISKWNCAMDTKVYKSQRYSLTMVLDRFDVDLNKRLHRLHPSLFCKPSCTFACDLQEIFAKCVSLCGSLASRGVVAFDLKPLNLLVNHRRGAQAEIVCSDFDGLQTVQFEENVLSRKVVIFVNLLLLAMHIRAFFNVVLATAFSKAAQPLLLDFWKECFHAPASVGAGVHALLAAKLETTPDRGILDSNELLGLKFTTRRLQRQFSCICYEYLFATKAATSWQHWVDRGPLVPQILRFALFQNEELSEDVKQLLSFPTNARGCELSGVGGVGGVGGAIQDDTDSSSE